MLFVNGWIVTHLLFVFFFLQIKKLTHGKLTLAYDVISADVRVDFHVVY